MYKRQVIGLRDLTKAAIQIQAKAYQALMPFMGIAVMYLLVVMFLTWLLGILERLTIKSQPSK